MGNISPNHHPEISKVNLGVRNNPGILVSGHDEEAGGRIEGSLTLVVFRVAFEPAAPPQRTVDFDAPEGTPIAGGARS